VDTSKPRARLDPLPVDHTPELKNEFANFIDTSGRVPNGVLIMQRNPALVKAFVQMGQALFAPQGRVDRGFKRLVSLVASRSAGCSY